MGRIKEAQIDAMTLEVEKLDAVDRIKKVLQDAEEIREPEVMAWCRTARAFLKDYSYGRKKTMADVLTVVYRRGVLEGEERILYRRLQFPIQTETDRERFIKDWDSVMNAYLEGVTDHVG